MRRVQLALLVTGVCVAVDWLCKKWLLTQMGIEAQVYNSEPAQLWLVPALAVVAFALLHMLRHVPGVWLAIGVACGGVLANQLDRALFGPVADFFPRPLTEPTIYFNIADVMIFVGMISVISCALWLGWRERSLTTAQ